MINTKDGGELYIAPMREKLREITALGEVTTGYRGVECANKIKIIESSKQIGNCFINELTWKSDAFTTFTTFKL